MPPVLPRFLRLCRFLTISIDSQPHKPHVEEFCHQHQFVFGERIKLMLINHVFHHVKGTDHHYMHCEGGHFYQHILYTMIVIMQQGMGIKQIIARDTIVSGKLVYNISTSYFMDTSTSYSTVTNSLQSIEHSQHQLYHTQHNNWHNWFNS